MVEVYGDINFLNI